MGQIKESKEGTRQDSNTQKNRKTINAPSPEGDTPQKIFKNAHLICMDELSHKRSQKVLIWRKLAK